MPSLGIKHRAMRRDTLEVTMSNPVRVLLAEDHTIVREGLRALLEGRDDVVVVGEASDGQAAIEKAQALRPDLVVMDLNMPRCNGVEATRRIRDALPETRVLVLSMHSGEEHVRPAIRAGAGGFLLKGSGLSDLVSAIHAVAAGNMFFSPEVASAVMQSGEASRRTASPPPGSQLTAREREILVLVAEGRSSPEIANHLKLSVKTVEGHRGRIMSKLNAKNVAGLVRHAIRMGLVSTDP